MGGISPSDVTYGSKKKIWWLCSAEHKWITLVNSRTASNRETSGCPYCSGNKVWVGFNDLETVNPTLSSQWHPTKNGQLTAQHVTKGSGKKIWWLCDNDHEWRSLVSDRSNGSGCPNCVNHVSKAEEDIKDYLESLNLIVEGSNRKILKGKELDLYVPARNIAVEFNGIYWHTELRGKDSSYHNNKWKACKDKSIQLLQIWEDDWRLKPELVKQTLVSKFASDSCRVASVVVELSEQQASSFLDENHLLGAAVGDHYFGLTVDGDIDSLQAVLAVNSDAVSNSLELVRFASSEGALVDFKALLAHMVSMLKPVSVSFVADNCSFEGEVFAAGGFKIVGSVAPDYMYVIRNNRVPRSEYPLERFQSDPKLLWEAELTEMELADLNGLARIWDAGKTLYRLDLSQSDR